MHVMLSAAHPVLAGPSTADPLSASFWLASLGAFGVFAVVFAETGLLAGFFLPGDSLLFTGGLFCSARAATSEHLSLGWVLAAAVLIRARRERRGRHGRHRRTARTPVLPEEST